METEKIVYRSHTKEEKEYCKLVLAEIERQIPAQYTNAVIVELRSRGITHLDDVYIQRVRNGSKFNRDVVDALKAITEPARLLSINELSKKMDTHLNNYVR